MEIIGTIMLVLGIAGMVIFYFTYLGGRKVSPKMHSLSVISTIIGICAFFVILTHWPIGIAKLVMLWLALMVAVIPTIVACILDSKHGYQVSQKFNFCSCEGFDTCRPGGQPKVFPLDPLILFGDSTLRGRKGAGSAEGEPYGLPFARQVPEKG